MSNQLCTTNLPCRDYGRWISPIPLKMLALHKMMFFYSHKDSCKLSIKSKQRGHRMHTIELPSELLSLRKHKSRHCKNLKFFVFRGAVFVQMSADIKKRSLEMKNLVTLLSCYFSKLGLLAWRLWTKEMWMGQMGARKEGRAIGYKLVYQVPEEI